MPGREGSWQRDQAGRAPLPQHHSSGARIELASLADIAENAMSAPPYVINYLTIASARQ